MEHFIRFLSLREQKNSLKSELFKVLSCYIIDSFE